MDTVEQEFLKDTYLKNCLVSKKAQGLPAPEIEKSFPMGTHLIQLPEPELLPDHQVSFLEMMELRSTIRQYSDEALSMKDLSYLLWCTQGVKMSLPGGGSMRTVPSAGARHALETYLYIQRVEGLDAGLYRFLPLEHALILLKPAETIETALLSGFKAAPMVKASAVTFMWGARLEAMTYAFDKRAYRYLFLDAGHVCQNLYLAAYTLNAGVCAVGAFYDAEINAALSLDGSNEFIVYAATVGKI